MSDAENATGLLNEDKERESPQQQQQQQQQRRTTKPGSSFKVTRVTGTSASSSAATQHAMVDVEVDDGKDVDAAATTSTSYFLGDEVRHSSQQHYDEDEDTLNSIATELNLDPDEFHQLLSRQRQEGNGGDGGRGGGETMHALTLDDQGRLTYTTTGPADGSGGGGATTTKLGERMRRRVNATPVEVVVADEDGGIPLPDNVSSPALGGNGGQSTASTGRFLSGDNTTLGAMSSADGGGAPSLGAFSTASNVSSIAIRSRSTGRSSSRTAGGASTASKTSYADSFASSNYTPARSGRGRRQRVGFHKNVVRDFVVYEVDNQVFVDIEYQRNRLGWFIMLIAVLADVVTQTHATYMITNVTPRLNLFAVMFWGAVWKIPLMLFVVAGVTLSGLVSVSHWQEMVRTKVGVGAWAWGLSISCALVLQVCVGQYEADRFIPPQYYPSLNLGIFWLLLYRRLRNKPVFFQEVLGAVVAFLGFALACGGSYSQPTKMELVAINLFLVALSVAFFVWFQATSYSAKYSPSIFVTAGPSVLTDLVLTLVAGLCVYAGRLDSIDFFALAKSENFGPGVFMALEVLATQIAYLAASRYLDVVSLAGAQALKSVILPFTIKFFVLEKLPPSIPVEDKTWGIFLWIGTPIVVIGCGVLIIFASVKRQFVERRIASAPALRRPVNPYRPRHDSCSSPSGSSSGFRNGSTRPATGPTPGSEIHLSNRVPLGGESNGSRNGANRSSRSNSVNGSPSQEQLQRRQVETTAGF